MWFIKIFSSNFDFTAIYDININLLFNYDIGNIKRVNFYNELRKPLPSIT